MSDPMDHHAPGGLLPVGRPLGDLNCGRPAPLLQVRAWESVPAVVELRWLEDGRLDAVYDPDRLTEAARVFFDAVRRAFGAPDMVLGDHQELTDGRRQVLREYAPGPDEDGRC